MQLEAFVNTWPSVTVENAGEFIKNHKQNEADYIKLMQENHCALVLPTNSIPVATLGLQTAVVKEAHEAGLVAAGHAFSVDITEVILKSGADGLTHTFFDQTPPHSIIDLYKQTNAFVIPTLALIASATKELQEWREKFTEIGARKGLIDDFSVQTMKQTVGMAAPSAKFEYAIDSVRILKEEGIDVLAGTDSAVGLEGLAIGPSLWMEMFIYIEKCGFKVTDVLSSATSIPPRRLGFHDRGFIGEGKRADLLLVKGDVTENLKHLWEGEGIVGVWKQGLKATQIHT
jgi:imidazolonepropionase-like amidohydrolase